MLSNDPVNFILSVISQIIGVEKTTFFSLLGMRVSLWDIDIMFGVVESIIVILIPTMYDPDVSEGGIYKRTKL